MNKTRHLIIAAFTILLAFALIAQVSFAQANLVSAPQLQYQQAVTDTAKIRTASALPKPQPIPAINTDNSPPLILY